MLRSPYIAFLLEGIDGLRLISVYYDTDHHHGLLHHTHLDHFILRQLGQHPLVVGDNPTIRGFHGFFDWDALTALELMFVVWNNSTIRSLHCVLNRNVLALPSFVVGDNSPVRSFNSIFNGNVLAFIVWDNSAIGRLYCILNRDVLSRLELSFAVWNNFAVRGFHGVLDRDVLAFAVGNNIPVRGLYCIFDGDVLSRLEFSLAVGHDFAVGCFDCNLDGNILTFEEFSLVIGYNVSVRGFDSVFYRDALSPNVSIEWPKFALLHSTLE